MKKNLLLILSLIFLSNISFAQKVYLANIEGEIDLGLAPYVKRVCEEAEQNFADALIFRVNTFGGRVDAATQIKDAILDCKVETVAFIDKRAISAGALISLSCEKIVMVPGASIGATTVVDQTGTKQSEKHQSYMRSEMRSTAEKNGRRTDIAEGMVDERVIVEGLVDSTQLITLTSAEAVSYGIADTILTSVDEVLKFIDLEDADIVESESNWAEGVVRFLTSPVISSLLIMVGLLGIFTEIKTPGWGLPGTAAIIALGLFFGTGYILELASVLEILLFILGVLLLLVEFFIVPGFGVVGLSGIIAIIASLFLGLLGDLDIVSMEMVSNAIIQLAVSLVSTIVIFYGLSKFLPKTDAWNRMILQTNIQEKSGYTTGISDLEHLIGKKGDAITDLRPSGTVKIENKRYDVVTQGEYIVKGTLVEVIIIEGSKVVVGVGGRERKSSSIGDC